MENAKTVVVEIKTTSGKVYKEINPMEMLNDREISAIQYKMSDEDEVVVLHADKDAKDNREILIALLTVIKEADQVIYVTADEVNVFADDDDDE